MQCFTAGSGDFIVGSGPLVYGGCDDVAANEEGYAHDCPGFLPGAEGPQQEPRAAVLQAREPCRRQAKAHGAGARMAALRLLP